MGNPLNILYGAPEYIKVGPYGTAESECRDVGFTDGGLSITPKYTVDKKKVDQSSATVAANLADVEFELKIALAEVTGENIQLAFGLSDDALTNGVLSVGSTITLPQKVIYVQGPGPGGGKRHIRFNKCVVTNPPTLESKKAYANLELTFDLLYDPTVESEKDAWWKMTDTAAGTPPTVSATTPADAATAVAVDSNLTATFSKAINGGDVTGTFFQVIKASDGTEVAGALSLSSDKLTVTFKPTQNLEASTPYLFIVSKGIRELSGAKLAASTIVNFTTA